MARVENSTCASKHESKVTIQHLLQQYLGTFYVRMVTSPPSATISFSHITSGVHSIPVVDSDATPIVRLYGQKTSSVHDFKDKVQLTTYFGPSKRAVKWKFGWPS
ncbi:hypothetical protein O6H91_16G083700 [Diphasiastrum complanatum]|uniref:Uncharacterized protein n=1 Tax=Diphasiastrum complanatum TaxID=34168 RepID=A0ACC2BEB1_DIPCM|nr:hypothetical protein O6H91_16G083700 [Diphasiastrum complanatum]